MKRNVLFFIWICLALSLQAARAQGPKQLEQQLAGTQEWQEQQLAGQREQQLLWQEGKRPRFCKVEGQHEGCQRQALEAVLGNAMPPDRRRERLRARDR